MGIEELAGGMDVEKEAYPTAMTGYAAKSLRRASTPEQLIQKKQYLEQELKKVNAALEFLEKNPEFTNGLHLISLALG